MLLVLAGITQRRQRIGGLARLRNEDRERAGIERHLAVAKLRGDIDVDRQPREPLEPVPRHHAGIVGGAAGGDGDAPERAEIERQRHRQRDALGHHVEIMRQRVADDFRLFVNFLGHEMAVIALVDEHHRGLRLEHVAVDDVAVGVVDFGARAMDDGAIAVFQIAHRVGERRERDRVRAEIHRIVAEADGERRALAGADQQIVFAGKQERQREGAAQPRQRRFDRLDRRAALGDLVADQVGDDFGVGFGRERDALGFELAPQFAEILDDAVMHDGEPVGGVRMRVGLVGPAMGRPAGVADADRPGERLAREFLFQILQLAFGAAPRQHAVLERGDAGGIIAAVFEALERIDQERRDRFAADDFDNAAHGDTDARY